MDLEMEGFSATQRYLTIARRERERTSRDCWEKTNVESVAAQRRRGGARALSFVALQPKLSLQPPPRPCRRTADAASARPSSAHCLQPSSPGLRSAAAPEVCLAPLLLLPARAKCWSLLC